MTPPSTHSPLTVVKCAHLLRQPKSCARATTVDSWSHAGRFSSVFEPYGERPATLPVQPPALTVRAGTGTGSNGSFQPSGNASACHAATDKPARGVSATSFHSHPNQRRSRSHGAPSVMHAARLEARRGVDSHHRGWERACGCAKAGYGPLQYLGAEAALRGGRGQHEALQCGSRLGAPWQQACSCQQLQRLSIPAPKPFYCTGCPYSALWRCRAWG